MKAEHEQEGGFIMKNNDPLLKIRFDGKAIDLLPQGTPLSRDFWDSPTIEELAESQNVKLMTNVRALFGIWSGEEDNGFEVAIDELRHPRVSGGKMK